jgi:hypothetical protein
MIPSLTYLDRYRNEGTRSYSRHADYSEALEKYRPNSANEGFELSAFRVPRTGMHVYSANPSPDVAARYLDGDTCLFCVHPQLLETFPDDPYLRRTQAEALHSSTIKITPSSSTRTLCVQEPGPPHALKVHFPFRVSRYGRKMRDEVVQQAINVSGELESGISALDPDFAYMREVLGITHRELDPEGGRGENWGFLVREMTPYPRIEENRTLIPGFALYGGDYFVEGKERLVWELVGEADPRDFILNSVMLPIIRHWIGSFRNFGFILEPHGQNTLLEADQSGRIHRIVHRDLNVGLDMRRRRDLSLPDGEMNRYNRMESGEFNSIGYDKFMGGHFFDQLVAEIQKRHPKLQPEDFQEPCREEFGRLFPDHEEYLPRTVNYFSEERDEFGKPLYQDTGKLPRWRP